VILLARSIEFIRLFESVLDRVLNDFADWIRINRIQIKVTLHFFSYLLGRVVFHVVDKSYFFYLCSCLDEDFDVDAKGFGRGRYFQQLRLLEIWLNVVGPLRITAGFSCTL